MRVASDKRNDAAARLRAAEAIHRDKVREAKGPVEQDKKLKNALKDRQAAELKVWRSSFPLRSFGSTVRGRARF